MTRGCRAFPILPVLLMLVAAGLSACTAPGDPAESAGATAAPSDVPGSPADILSEGNVEALYGSPDPTIRRVGLLLPLSGAGAESGRELLDAASLALFDVGNPRIELVIGDTRGAAEGGSAARRVLDADPELVVGPLFSSAVRTAAPAVREAGIDMIVLSSDLTVAQQGVFVLGLAPEDQVARVVDHAASRGYLRFAVLAPGTGFGERMADALEAAVANSSGAMMTARMSYDPEGGGIEAAVEALAALPVNRSHLSAQVSELLSRGDAASDAALRRLANTNSRGTMAFDVLFVPESGPLLHRLAAWLGHHDFNPARTRLLGLANWNDDPALLREPVMKGAWFAAAPDTGRTRFARRFRDTYGSEASRIATLGYDAMALAATIAGSDRSITDWRGFAGLDGLFRFAGNGRPERGLAVMEITPEGVVVADPAPSSFGEPMQAPATDS